MEESFEQVYAKYYSIVYRYLVSLTKNADLSEELAQETFFKALQHIDQYDPGKKMLTWLCSIAKNTYFSEKKRWSRSAEMPEDLMSEDQVVDQIILGEDSKQVLQAVHALGEPYKEVFTLRTYGEVSFRQIAELFGKTESWARVTYYRSKTKIKETMKNVEM